MLNILYLVFSHIVPCHIAVGTQMFKYVVKMKQSSHTTNNESFNKFHNYFILFYFFK